MSNDAGAPRSAFVDISTAAAMLGVSYSAVWESLRRDDFPVPAVRVGNRWRISRAALDRLAGVAVADAERGERY